MSDRNKVTLPLVCLLIFAGGVAPFTGVIMSLLLAITNLLFAGLLLMVAHCVGQNVRRGFAAFTGLAIVLCVLVSSPNPLSSIIYIILFAWLLRVLEVSGALNLKLPSFM